MKEDSDFELVFWKGLTEAPYSGPDTHLYTSLTFFFLVPVAALLVQMARTQAGIAGDWVMCFAKSQRSPETHDRKVQSEFSKFWSIMVEHGTQCSRGQIKPHS